MILSAGQRSAFSVNESSKSISAEEATPSRSRSRNEPYYMYTSPKAKRIYRNELRRLIAEVKVRIDDCHALAKL
ncbi:unnamed protein product [Litomosoides sigmodontis]|uniref:Uncharacterized protein n=1 Tax=Litomosoides sigmodontis TaxID=42156 RepID=A0A3P6TKB0_LITSI|nr:unnamed protein product [Litomosoides sigmodontis]